MSGALYFDSYDSGLGRELLLCAGNSDGPRLLILPPLFDEMNRMRRTLVMAMRILSDMGMNSVLPDLPGLNESTTPLSQCRLSDWQTAVRAIIVGCKVTHVAILRSACLLDCGASPLPRWRNAAVGGDRVITQMIRAQLASDKANGARSTRADYEGGDGLLQLAGFTLSAAMVQDLNDAALLPLNGLHDRHVDTSLGPALWLRAEPGESTDMAQALAAQWAEWMTP